MRLKRNLFQEAVGRGWWGGGLVNARLLLRGCFYVKDTPSDAKKQRTAVRVALQ
jgi:hypothetical protein